MKRSTSTPEHIGLARRRAKGLTAATAIGILGLSLTSGVMPALATGNQSSETEVAPAPSYIQGEFSPELDPVLGKEEAPRPLISMEQVEAVEAEEKAPSARNLQSVDPDAFSKSSTECDSAGIAGKSGQALVTAIKGSTVDCINTLFNASGSTAADLFKEADMLTVAQQLRGDASSYDGTNSESAAQLILYLRAGYYVQFYQSSTVGNYGPGLKTLVGDALETLFNNTNAFTVTEENGSTLSEAITLIDSSENNARFLQVLVQMLEDFSPERAQSWYFRAATNNVFTVLFRGHQVPEFSGAVVNDPQIIDALHEFASANMDLLATDNAYLVSNAGRELARFLGDSQLKSLAKPKVIDLLSRTNISGDTAGLWVGLADMVDYYDPQNCADYGTCDLAERLRAEVLSQERECSSSIEFKTQSVSDEEFNESCTSLQEQDQYFYAVAGTNTPVASDNNTSLEVAVFSTSIDYQTYAGAIFGIDTNNGGMYLEGDPSQPDNVPTFVAYEADWMLPDFQIWNLNHEYTHYLDGRFNMHGDFAAGMTTPTIWWVEGFGEYISYGYRGEAYTAANQLAAQKTYKLSELFDTTYSHDTDRIYRWGYLAVNFMINEHPQELQTVLDMYREGKWNDARAYLKNSISTSYDAEFNNFLDTCASGNCEPPAPDGSTDPTPEPTDPTTEPTDPTTEPTDPGTCTSSGETLSSGCATAELSGNSDDLDYFTIYVEEGTTELEITTNGGSGNADLYYSPWSWAGPDHHNYRSTQSGNSESILVPNPPAGYNYISLNGASDYSGVKLEATTR